MEYDETALRERVAVLLPLRRAALAASCAERLMPLYEWIVGASASDDAAGIRSALDLAWSADASAQAVEQAQLEVEQLVPDEDDGHAPVDLALVQNAVAAVAYSLRAKGSNEAQDVVWAARQLYEAADYIAQREAPNGSCVGDLEREAPIQLVLHGLANSLGGLNHASLDQLRAAARADGDALLALFKGPDP